MGPASDLIRVHPYPYQNNIWASLLTFKIPKQPIVNLLDQICGPEEGSGSKIKNTSFRKNTIGPGQVGFG